jgi:cell division protein ZapE
VQLSTKSGTICSLVEIQPNPTLGEVLDQLVPPREFTKARFDNYLPDSNFPSQSSALSAARSFVRPGIIGSFFTRAKAPNYLGIYLDGGFGVGKTHLLAAIWHEFSGKKAFGSFLAYTSLIGLLGFADALKHLSRYELICIDEFELDDPGGHHADVKAFIRTWLEGNQVRCNVKYTSECIGGGPICCTRFRKGDFGNGR